MSALRSFPSNIPVEVANETAINYIRIGEYRTTEAPMKNLASAFKALADESRLRILNILIHSGELCVCDIERVMGFTQTKVSRHLGYLKRAGLVTDRREGLWILYSIAQPKDDEHREIMKCIRQLLEPNPVAQKDAKELAKSIKKGCCTTFSVIQPDKIPVKFTLN